MPIIALVGGTKDSRDRVAAIMAKHPRSHCQLLGELHHNTVEGRRDAINRAVLLFQRSGGDDAANLLILTQLNSTQELEIVRRAGGVFACLPGPVPSRYVLPATSYFLNDEDRDNRHFQRPHDVLDRIITNFMIARRKRPSSTITLDALDFIYRNHQRGVENLAARLNLSRMTVVEAACSMGLKLDGLTPDLRQLQTKLLAKRQETAA